ncbi:ParB/Srx family N-terminal domain-containing protein, partial [Sphingobium yanoikuyae]|uniref:ParB/Srx family N-terminal domain-containing protein n=1 Tax=Sphingobium yanoikuyae TaxID=13690 RepID=UPI001F3F7C3A
MSQTPIPVPAANLTKSPVNVRTRGDADADAELEASILAHGLIQNLVGVPVSRKKGHYRITAGGRRLDAVHRLIEKGSLPADHAIPVLILDNTKNGREVSLVENFERLPMLGHVSRLSFDRKNKRMVCLFQAARSAYPKSWRRAAWNKHLRG